MEIGAQEIEKEAILNIGNATTLDEMEHLRILFLGKKGKITELLRTLKDLPAEQRKTAGQEANSLKDRIHALLDERMLWVKRQSISMQWANERVDITIPGTPLPLGSIHPITKTMEDIYSFFSSIGFGIAEGPEIETDYFNFEALNTPPDHPARDMWDTLYLSGTSSMLRTHTSPVQVRVMQKVKPPFRFIFPGRVYRRDQMDASHATCFHQVEGLLIDRMTTFAELKGVLSALAHRLFSGELHVRFYPTYFPFTEPSAEMSIECFCKGQGCPVCKGSGWIEILGCGMVHPKVLAKQDIDPEKWRGFAFGMGSERIAMLRYGIPDIRLFLENHMQFLKQFRGI